MAGRSTPPESLPRRERTLLEQLLAQGPLTAEAAGMSLDPPLIPQAARVLLDRLRRRGLVARDDSTRPFQYRALLDRSSAANRALDRVTQLFFDGSPVRTMSALLGSHRGALSAEEISELQELIKRARAKGKAS